MAGLHITHATTSKKNAGISRLNTRLLSYMLYMQISILLAYLIQLPHCNYYEQTQLALG